MIGRNIPFTDYQEFAELPFVKLAGTKRLVFERRENRRVHLASFAARTVGIDREHQRVGIERAWNEELSVLRDNNCRARGRQPMDGDDDYLVDPVEDLDVVTTLDCTSRRRHQRTRTQLRRHDAHGAQFGL